MKLLFVILTLIATTALAAEPKSSSVFSTDEEIRYYSIKENPAEGFMENKFFHGRLIRQAAKSPNLSQLSVYEFQAPKKTRALSESLCHKHIVSVLGELSADRMTVKSSQYKKNYCVVATSYVSKELPIKEELLLIGFHEKKIYAFRARSEQAITEGERLELEEFFLGLK